MVAFSTLHAFVFVASTGNALSFGSFLGRSAGGRVTSVSPRLQQTTVLNNIWSNSQAVEDYKVRGGKSFFFLVAVLVKVSSSSQNDFEVLCAIGSV